MSEDALGAALRARLGGFAPRVLLTLGSGLGQLAEQLTNPIVVDFAAIGLTRATVRGHAGRFLAGRLAGVDVLIQQGRCHLYEGVAAADVVAPVRAAAAVGVTTFVVTNAAGGLAPDLRAGQLVVIRDQLNLTGHSPLIGAPAFVDMTQAYDPALCAMAHAGAEAAGVALGTGVYAGVVGPAYETPAEAAMLRVLGADMVGMSTVCEVIVARSLGLAVCGLSLVTNVHQPGAGPISHAEVMQAGAHGAGDMATVVRGFLARLAKNGH